jgi:hypothetical protein
MNKLNLNDRVKFNQDYLHGANHARKGDTGTVTNLIHGTDCIDVKLDNGGSAKGLFEYRVDRVNETPKVNPHEFKVGDKGVTRDGRKYEVLAVFPNRSKRVIADVAGEVRDFYKDGSYTLGKNTCDLIPAKKVVTHFINVHRDGSITGHYQDANKARGWASAACVLIAHPVTIELP